MTSLNAPTMQSDFAAIARRLDAVGNRFRLAHVLRALGLFVGVTVPLTTGAVLLVGAFTLPGWMNVALGVLLLGIIALAYVRLLHRPIFLRPTYAEIARLVEQHGTAKLGLHNELINAVLLATDLDAVAKGQPVAGGRWIPAVLRELNARTSELHLETAVPWKQPRNAWLSSGALIVLCVLAIGLFPGAFWHGLAVLGRPSAFVPKVGLVKIINVEPGNDSVLAGQSLNFVVTAESPESKVVDAKIAITFVSGKSVSYPMSVFGNSNTQYRYQLATAAENLDYVITVGDSQSDRYHIDVLPKIQLVSYRLEITPPPYTGKAKREVALTGREATATKASVEVPQGSTVQISATLDLPVKEALVDVAGTPPQPMSPSADGKTFTATLTAKDSFKYLVQLNDGANRTLKRLPDDADASTPVRHDELAFYSVTVQADQPPTVTVTEPARDVDAKPGEKLPLAAQASDDYGLTEVLLEIARNDEKQFRAIKSWPIARENSAKPATIKYLLDLPAGDYKLGDTLRYRFVATDNRNLTSLDSALGPQTTAGQVFSVSFNDTAAIAAKSTKLWDELRKQLTVLLDRQISLRHDSEGLKTATAIEDARKITTGISSGQTKLRLDMATLAKDFPFEPAMKLIQKSLQVLVTEDATAAIDRASDILLLSDTKSLAPLGTRLRQNQSRIIDVLQSLLAIATSEEKKTPAVVDKEGGDLPNDAKDAWKKMAEELKDFEKEQKAVIDATADLAKKPKDQFDKNDEQKLKDLAATEDKWEKFLNQRLVDLSKIAEQDQSGAGLLEEVVQMKVELAMAQKALETKQTEIATALEDNGLENAKSLTTHIERWLQQQPDRTNWQMEEPAKQNETPAAELPKQLQDMVGDLMDKEEDLTDSMESLGSKWNDSLDKGAGWDAADGPISNQSAQGVTGNQLPKNMEIQGRSGEGREGRSSGEMVGAEAEGKGGRRTPTRMTEDPFSSGKVDDKSKEPAGGATGGGKKGAFGGEGLEGPAPEGMQDPMQRMKGQQAALRNEAERLQLQMHAAGYENFKLFEASILMKKSEDALKQYHYHTALFYQQQAVQSLNTAKVLAAGEVHVTMDTTPPASATTQREIQDALSGPLPRGYAAPVKAYFEKLATEDQP